MYDRIKITKIINDVEVEFNNLISFGLTENSDDASLYATSMSLMVIMTRTIDLVEEIILKNEWGMPQRYKEYFTLLGNKGLIDKKLCTELGKLADWRNMIAHEYFNVDRKQILKLKKDIYYVKDLIEKVKKIVAMNITK